MRLITPTDPEQPRPESEAGESAPLKPAPNAPLSFVPHEDGDGTSPRQPIRLRTNRYGDLNEHDLLHLLDSIEDERARSRFRESIYISLFIWIAIAWLVLYGPRYLWHAPKLVTPFEVLHQRELTQLNMPAMHAPPPSIPRAQPKVDTRTLEHLRSMEPPPRPAAPAETPKIAPTPAPAITNNAPPAPAPVLPLPNAPQPTARTTPPVVAEAPTPQPSAKPNFNTNRSAESSIDDAVRNAARDHTGGGYGARSGNGNSPLNFGGVEILSDRQGVDFNPYIRRILADIYRNWMPLIPEECKPPLSKDGEVLVRFSILPDGRIGLPNGQPGGMWLDGSTHDDAINRSAWGSITSEGQFPPLPAQFHGPNLELRIHYYVNKQPE